MASAEEIKARIGSIRQTKKVTDAMYMISSVKMRRAKREVISTEPYFNALKEQISDLFLYIPETNNRYFRVLLPEGQTFRRRGLLLVTSDKGLAGSYNQTAIRAAEDYVALHPDASSLLSANAEDTIALTTAYALLRISTTQRHSRQFGKHVIYVMICWNITTIISWMK